MVASRSWLLLASVILLTTIACGDVGDDDDDPSPTTADNVPRELHGAGAASDGTSIWVAGGALMTRDLYQRVTRPSVPIADDDWNSVRARPNRVVAQYAPDGRLLQLVEVGDELEYLSEFRVASTPAGAVLAGIRCAAPLVERCDVVPFAMTIIDGEVTEVDLHLDDDAEFGDVHIAGIVGDDVIVAMGEHPGSALIANRAVNARAIDVASASARTISLPRRQSFPAAVCATDDGVLATTSSAEDALGLDGIDLWRLDVDRPAAPTLIATLERKDRKGSYPLDIGMRCADGQAVVRIAISSGGGPHELVVVKTGDGAEIGHGLSSVLPFAPGFEFLAAQLVDIEVEHGDLGQRKGLTFFAEGVPPVVAVGDRVVDVTELLVHPPGSDGPPSPEVAWP